MNGFKCRSRYFNLNLFSRKLILMGYTKDIGCEWNVIFLNCKFPIS